MAYSDVPWITSLQYAFQDAQNLYLYSHGIQSTSERTCEVDVDIVEVDVETDFKIVQCFVHPTHLP